MATYKTFTTLGDFGPWVSKLILDLPCEVRADEVSPATFNVFCTRRETADGSVVMRTEKGADHATPSQGYAEVLAAYPCTEEGAPLPESAHVALEMGEVRVNKRIEGSVMQSRFLVNDYRVTQLAELPGKDAPVSGLVFDECAGDVCPALDGWHEDVQAKAVDDIRLGYGYYEPSFSPFTMSWNEKPQPAPEKAALIVWLHGAGEGGNETGRPWPPQRDDARHHRGGTGHHHRMPDALSQRHPRRLALTLFALDRQRARGGGLMGIARSGRSRWPCSGGFSRRLHLADRGDELLHAVALVAVDKAHLRRPVLLQYQLPVLVPRLPGWCSRDVEQLDELLDRADTVAPRVLQSGVDQAFTLGDELGCLPLLLGKLCFLSCDVRAQFCEALQSTVSSHHNHS